MAGKSLVAAVLIALSATAAAAQSSAAKKEAAQKQAEKKQAAEQIKKEVKGLIADANDAARTNPEKAYDILRRALDAAQDPALSKSERLDLSVMVETRMDDVRKQMETLAKAKASSMSNQTASNQKGNASSTSAAGKKGQFSPSSSFASGSFTPVVGGDYRSVRISVRGTFGMITPTGPMIPVQIPVPQFFYGPGKGFTSGPPEKIFQMFFPAPRATIFQINSAASVPADGFASLGGFDSSMSARNEFGVPGLGHIPYAGRLFRNVGQGSSTSRVGLGVSARVFSLLEEDERLLASRAP